MKQQPTPTIRFANLAVSQLAWFGTVLGAARHAPLWGTACVLAAIGWHLAVSARPAREAWLVLLASLVGLGVETWIVFQGNVSALEQNELVKNYYLGAGA